LQIFLQISISKLKLHTNINLDYITQQLQQFVKKFGTLENKSANSEHLEPFRKIQWKCNTIVRIFDRKDYKQFISCNKFSTNTSLLQSEDRTFTITMSQSRKNGNLLSSVRHPHLSTTDQPKWLTQISNILYIPEHPCIWCGIIIYIFF